MIDLSSEEELKQLFNSAEKIQLSDWKGKCLYDVGSGGFFVSVADLLEHYIEESNSGIPVVWPTCVWDTTEHKLQLDAEDILDRELDVVPEHVHLDLFHSIHYESLQKVLDQWLKDHPEMSWCEPNFQRAILLPAGLLTDALLSKEPPEEEL